MGLGDHLVAIQVLAVSEEWVAVPPGLRESFDGDGFAPCNLVRGGPRAPTAPCRRGRVGGCPMRVAWHRADLRSGVPSVTKPTPGLHVNQWHSCRGWRAGGFREPDPMARPPPPPPQTHKGTYTQARRHLPPASATAGSGGGQQSGRPCDRTPGYGRPVGSGSEGGADRG